MQKLLKEKTNLVPTGLNSIYLNLKSQLENKEMTPLNHNVLELVQLVSVFLDCTKIMYANIVHQQCEEHEQIIKQLLAE